MENFFFFFIKILQISIYLENHRRELKNFFTERVRKIQANTSVKKKWKIFFFLIKSKYRKFQSFRIQREQNKIFFWKRVRKLQSIT